MKKFIFLILVVMGTLLFFTCNKDKSIFEDEIVFQDILNEYNMDNGEFEEGDLISGQLVIDKSEELVIIAVIQDEQLQNHTAYYYQPTNDIILSSNTIMDGTILFLKEQILIRNNETKEVNLIKLNDYIGEINFKNLLFKQKILSNGIGKTRVQFLKNSSNNSLSRELQILPVEGTCVCKLRRPGSPAASCSSGGQGSTSCSCCGCSVSCSGSYYSCCNP